MIGFLSGTLVRKSALDCIVDVNGVGYRVACSSTTLAALPGEGGPCTLWTHVHVREDALALYGFASEREQQMFESLLTVTGVGPKVALQVCSAFAPDAFARAIAAEDAASIASVPGIGKKTAQRMVIDLRDRFGGADVPSGGSDVLAQARSVLENLGYSPGEIVVALGGASPSSDDAVEDVVKSALKALA